MPLRSTQASHVKDSNSSDERCDRASADTPTLEEPLSVRPWNCLLAPPAGIRRDASAARLSLAFDRRAAAVGHAERSDRRQQLALGHDHFALGARKLDARIEQVFFGVEHFDR